MRAFIVERRHVLLTNEDMTAQRLEEIFTDEEGMDLLEEFDAARGVVFSQTVKATPATIEVASDQVQSARELLAPASASDSAASVEEPKPEEFECLACVRKFRTRGYLALHRMHKHPDKARHMTVEASAPNGPVKCSECSERFNTPSALGEHHKRAHLTGEALKRARREAGLS